MSLLKELEKQNGGQKKLSEITGIKQTTLSMAGKSNNVVGYTYNLAKKVCKDGVFKLQTVEDGHLITVSREKI